MVRSAVPPTPRPAVIGDVARLAGVSRQTVSRVLNDSEQVQHDTRERVHAAMAKLDYRPNPVARALATGRSQVLGVITMDTALFGPTSALLAIERAAHARGFYVSITSLQSPDAASLLAAAQNLRRQAVEGILVIAPLRQVAEAAKLLPPDLPVVAVEAGLADGVPLVAVDQVGGAEEATRHLLDLGHRTVWHIAGPPDWLEAADRVTGWRSALSNAGVAAPDILHGDWSAQSGYDRAAELVADPDVTAVFVANDTMALGLIKRMHEVGRPMRSISVVGFDDAPEAAFYTPALTTVRQDFSEVGRRSFDLLVDHIRGSAPPVGRINIAPELIIRASTGPPMD